MNIKQQPSASPKRSFKNFVGIDVSKFKLDIAVFSGTQLVEQKIIPNQPELLLEWIGAIRKLPGFSNRNTVFCLEHTGKYSNHLLECLSRHKAQIVVENPIHIKRSIGLVRGKNDKVDAVRIAHFARKNSQDLRLWSPRRHKVKVLMELSTIRNRLLSISKMLKTPLKDNYLFLSPKLQQLQSRHCNKSKLSVAADLKKIDQAINKTIVDDENLSRINRLLTSVPGIGRLTALQMLITTNEFRSIDCPKKFACYAGLAPFTDESGTLRSRARVSHFANKRMKALLHMGALKAITADPELGAYYLRKTKDEKKPKMLVINAIRNKLVLRAFACVKQNRLFFLKLPIVDACDHGHRLKDS